MVHAQAPTIEQPRLARRSLLRWGLAGVAGLAGSAGLSGCATPRTAALPALPVDGPAPPPADAVAPFSAGSAGGLPPGWQPYVMRRDRSTTHYALVDEGRSPVLRAHASSSTSGLRCPVDIDPQRQGVLRFSWRVPRAPVGATVADPHLDDSPARVILAFDGDIARLSVRERLFYEQVELFTGHRLPYATLMYVWDSQVPPGTVIVNHRTSRIRYLTVESGDARTGPWRHHQRDVVADYAKVFGEAPGRIDSVGVLTDSEALKLDLEAFYGDITLTAA
ncbi:DUF3047 domain-containing protein [Ideonella sp. A 288]|uniref:DUF3047 domain-containing protein n=1 Tax=Ideonella sp. A 288 TaxID=1962181 RepID=UPI001303E7F5|nr:DUF3047 domain-containing protein [Ideonella sp. A 288]